MDTATAEPDRHTSPDAENDLDCRTVFTVCCPAELGDPVLLTDVELTNDQHGELDVFAGECERCGSWITARAIGGFLFEVASETRPL